jgi:uncharacterized protein YacL
MKVKELMDIIILESDDELIKFIDQEFGQNSSNSVHKIKCNLSTLSKVDEDILNYGVSRMKKIEDNNDYSKFITVLTTLIIALVAGYSGLFGLLSKNPIYQNIISIALIGFIIYYFSNSIGRANKRRSQAVFFRNLLECASKKK